MIEFNGSYNAAALRTKFANPVKSDRFHEWLRKQYAYISSLSYRDRDILNSYTRFGYTIINHFIRGALTTDMIKAFLKTKEQDNISFLGYFLFDQYDTFATVIRLPHRLAMLEYDGEAKLNTAVIVDIFKENAEFFVKPRNFAPLLAQYRDDLHNIIAGAPRLESPLVVYRGFQSEAHLRGLEFIDESFVSTSLSVDIAAKSFAKKEFNADISSNVFGGVYEIMIDSQIPCIFMQFISHFPEEYEILLAPGLHFIYDSNVHLKYRSVHAKHTGDMERIAIIHAIVEPLEFGPVEPYETVRINVSAANIRGTRKGGRRMKRTRRLR